MAPAQSTCAAERAKVRGHKTPGYEWCVTGKFGCFELLQEVDGRTKLYYCRLCDKECSQLAHYESKDHRKMMKHWWKAIDAGEEPWKERTDGGMCGPHFQSTSITELLGYDTEEEIQPPVDVVPTIGDEPKGKGKGDSKLSALEERVSALEAALATLQAALATLEADKRATREQQDNAGKGSVTAWGKGPPGVQVLDPTFGKGNPAWSSNSWYTKGHPGGPAGPGGWFEPSPWLYQPQWPPSSDGVDRLLHDGVV